MKIFRFFLPLLTGLLPSGDFFAQPASLRDADFTFVFMTDMHLRPDSAVSAAFGKLVAKVKPLNPDFILSGGDQVFDVMRGNLKKSDSLYRFYVQKSREFGIPVYNCVGNHELFGIYPESDVDSTHADYKYGMYRRYLGAPYYSFDHKGWHFVVLNSLDVVDKRYIGRVAPEQLTWLRKDLAATGRDTPVVLMLHIPLVTAFGQIYPRNDGSDSKPLVTNRDEVLEVFRNHNLKFVLQGHLHWFEALNIEGKTRFITGGSVAGRPSWKGTRHGPRGFVHFRVKGEQAHWEFIDYEK